MMEFSLLIILIWIAQIMPVWHLQLLDLRSILKLIEEHIIFFRDQDPGGNLDRQLFSAIFWRKMVEGGASVLHHADERLTAQGYAGFSAFELELIGAQEKALAEKQSEIWNLIEQRFQ